MKRLLLWLILTLTSGLLYAQQDFIVTHYTQNNGLPQNSINDLYWDKNDFLWLSTEEGLVRFDGNSFYTFNISNTPFIKSDRFRWILNNVEQRLFSVTAYGNIVEIDGSAIKPLLQTEGDYPFKGILPRPDLIQHIVSKPGNSLQKIKQVPFQFLFIDRQVYLLNFNCIYLVNDNEQIVDSIPLNRKIQQVFNIGNDGYALSNNELFYIDIRSKKMVPLRMPETVKKATVLAFYPKPFSNEIFVSVDKKIYSMTVIKKNLSVHLQPIIDVSGIVVGEISNIRQNSNNHTLAIGSVTNGLYIFKPRLFSTRVHSNPHIKFNGYYAQVIINDSTILDSYGDIITPFTSKTSAYDFTNANVKVLYKSKDNVLWSGKSDTLVYQIDGRRRVFIPVPPNEGVNNILPWGDSLLVVTARELLIIYRLKVLKKIPFVRQDRPWPIENWTFALIEKDRILLAADNSIYSILPGNKYKITKLFDYPFVRFMKQYEDWIIGTSYGQGIFVIYQDKIIRLPIDRLQRLQKAHSIIITEKKQVFISTNNGLFKTTVDEIRNFISGKTSDIYYQYYDHHEGIDNSEFNGACYPSAIALRSGYLSFPNMSGMIWFRPDSFAIPGPLPKRFYLNEAEIDGQVIAPSDTIILPATAEKLGLRYSLVYWQNPYNIKLDYQLKGFTQNWSQMPPPGQTLTFTNLPAGIYTLTIRAQTGFRESDISYSQIYIHKLPHYYETVWFVLLLISVAVLIIIYLIYLYNNRLIKQNAMLEKRVAERTQSLEKTNEDLRNSENELKQSVDVKNKLISIISHDIVTPLKFISLVSKNIRTARENNNAHEVIKEIHHTSQRLFDNAQNILNWVRYQNNLISVNKVNVSPYAVVEELCELFRDVVAMHKSQIINDVDMDDIIQTDTNILTIIIQNILSNAVKYTHSCVIHITSASSEKGYTITIADDGQGMSANNLSRIDTIKNKTNTVYFDDNADGTGLGYIIIFELAELLSASVTVESKPNMGTIVTITF
jgi:signal transduction histidine kinase